MLMYKSVGTALLLAQLALANAQTTQHSPTLKALVPKKVKPDSIPKQVHIVGLGDFPKEWLRAKTTVQEAEKNNMISLPWLGPSPVPFGYINDQWTALKALLHPGDELWLVSSPEEEWANLAGVEGICIVRDKKVVASMLTRMN